MFSDKKDKTSHSAPLTSQNIVAQGSKIQGDLESSGDFRIDGTVEGNLKISGKVVVGKSGYINGSLSGTDAHFEGKFSGKLTLSGTLTLKSSAQIEGDVFISKLAVEPGAVFNATCSMKGSTQTLNKGEQDSRQKAKQEQTA